MSLIDELEAIVADDPEIDSEELAYKVFADVMQDKIFDTDHRWYDIWEIVYERNDEYVKGFYCIGSTEIQEDTEFGWTFKVVYPSVVEVTVYE